MTKQSDEHLTIEQRSAFLDKQLSSQELAIVDAHLRDCQRCQQALAELRQTVALLHALPQVEVPRSFTLPARIASIQQPAYTNPVVTPISQSRRAGQNTLQRTIRVMSSLAAVLGLIFILSSFVTALPYGGPTSTASSGSTSSNAPGSTAQRNLTPNQRATARPGTQPVGAASPGVLPSKTPTPTPTPMSTHAVKQGTPVSTGPPGQPAPPVLDLSGPAGHLVIGSALLVLGILGFALARRR